jgi:hypothetical protein
MDDSAGNPPESQIPAEATRARTSPFLARIGSARRRFLSLPGANRALGWFRAALDLCARNAAALIGAAWFIAALAVTLWVWGLEPIAFPATDEAVNRLSALLVQRTGLPFAKLPFSDPEDLAHMRLWLSIGEYAVPSYPPLTFYLYGLLGWLGKPGFALIAALPASGAAAFAAGTAQLLPPPRRWLAFVAPTLGFPGLYWLLRPWMNISLLLTCLCWGFFYWACWRRYGTTRWQALALLSVGAGASVRPDYAAYVLLAALLFCLAADPARWKVSLALVVAAGACAVGANLILNKVITGDPLRAAYQILMDQEADQPSNSLLRMARQLLLPMGWPTASDAERFFLNYAVNMGPLWLLLLGQLALVPLLLRQTWAARLLYLAGVLVLVGLVLARMDPGTFGAAESTGVVSHSLPRYWAPVYLFAALPPILFFGTCRRLLVVIPGAALACVLAWLSVREIHTRQPTSFIYIERFVRTAFDRTAGRASIPSNAIVYSRVFDKVLWSRWQLGIVDDKRPEATATSMQRAVRAGLPVFMIEPRFPRRLRALDRAMRSKQLGTARVDARRGIYRIEGR